MGYYLLDHPNAYALAYWAKQGKKRGYWGYPTRTKPIQGFVEHIPVAIQDLEGSDPTAENVARYFSTTDRPASAHVCIDADSTVECLPDEVTAFHAKDGNSNGLGVEQGWGHLDWGKNPARDLQVIALSAKWHAPRVKRYDVPLQRVTAAQWNGGVKGFIDHSRLDPTRRLDPGPNFPWQTLFDLIRLELYMATLNDEEIRFLQAMIAGVKAVNSNEDFAVALIKDFRERKATEGDG